MDSNTIERSQSTYEQTRKINRAALKALLIIVFMGWLLIWIMVPTMTYKSKWTSKFKAKANSTYFGGQGTNLLIFSFPVMFIAFISCVYLHFEKTSDSQSTGGSHVRLVFLRSPVFVKAPFGIVTGMELMFSTMFIILLIWSIAHYLHVSFQDPYMNKEGAQSLNNKFQRASLTLGHTGNICWAFLFFPVTRGSSLLRVVGLTSEASIKYHIWLGHLSMILFIAHGVCFIIYWAMTDQMSEV